MKHYLSGPLFLGLIVTMGFIPMSVWAASAWPASTQGTSIGGGFAGMTPAFEPSGIEWLSGRSQFVVVGDEGQVATMNADGSAAKVWDLGRSYDLEGVAVADGNSSRVYLLDENTSSALEFDLTTGTLTGKVWSFADKLSEIDGSGAEALAYANGAFYVGWQYDGDIYVYPADLAVSGSQVFEREIHMTSGYVDLAGLTYNSDTQRLYALYDGLNLIEERSLSGELLASYTAPGVNQEGIAFVNNCAGSNATVAIAEDSGNVVSYAGYPISCISPAPAPAPAPEPTPEPTPEPAPEPELITITSVSGVRDGDILVAYSDGSTVRYSIWSKTTRTKTSVQPLTDPTHYLVILGKQVAVVDAMDGTILGTRSKPRSSSVLYSWANSF